MEIGNNVFEIASICDIAVSAEILAKIREQVKKD